MFKVILKQAEHNIKKGIRYRSEAMYITFSFFYCRVVCELYTVWRHTWCCFCLIASSVRFPAIADVMHTVVGSVMSVMSVCSFNFIKKENGYLSLHKIWYHFIRNGYVFVSGICFVNFVSIQLDSAQVWFNPTARNSS